MSSVELNVINKKNKTTGSKTNVISNCGKTKNKTIIGNTGKANSKQRQWKYLKFEKMVRDRSIETVRAVGGDVVYDLLSREKKIFYLKQKLIEEAMEVFEAKNDIEVADEIGDVLDVLKELIKTAKVKRYKIWQARRKKTKYRGKFKKGIYCHYVKLPYELNEKWMDKYEDITDKIEKTQQSIKTDRTGKTNKKSC